MLTHKRRQKLELFWLPRPRRSPHDFLGTKIRWLEKSGTYEIVRFTEGIGDYMVFKCGSRIAVARSLNRAKRAALQNAERSGLLL